MVVRSYLTLLILAVPFLLPVSVVHATGCTTPLHVAHDGPSPYQNYLADCNGNLVHLTGINYGDHPLNYPQFGLNSSADASAIQHAGFNAVRLVAEWGHVETSASDSSFTYNLAALTTRVGYLTSQGLYVVIKLHVDADSTADFNNLNAFLGPTQYCNLASDIPSGGGPSRFSNYFYQTTPAQNSSDGMAHLYSLWKTVSSSFASNPLVIGYDFLNEPTRDYTGHSSNPSCAIGSVAESSIRSSYHANVNGLISYLRCTGTPSSTCSGNGDNRVYFIEEAPFFAFYGQSSVGLTFTPYTDTLLGFDNTVSSVHYYKDEFRNPSVASVSWVACSAKPSDLYAFWSNSASSSNVGGCPTGNNGVSTVPLWVTQAQAQYTGQAFDVGEYGDIFDVNNTVISSTQPSGVNDNQGFTNQYGTSNFDWIRNATNMFVNTAGSVGIFYYASGTDNNWMPTFTIAASPASVRLFCSYAIGCDPGSANSTLSFTSVNGFSGTLTLNYTGPHGSYPYVTGPSSVSVPMIGSSTITITAHAAGTTSGTYVWVVNATGGYPAISALTISYTWCRNCVVPPP